MEHSNNALEILSCAFFSAPIEDDIVKQFNFLNSENKNTYFLKVLMNPHIFNLSEQILIKLFNSLDQKVRDDYSIYLVNAISLAGLIDIFNNSLTSEGRVSIFFQMNSRLSVNALTDISGYLSAEEKKIILQKANKANDKPLKNYLRSLLSLCKTPKSGEYDKSKSK